MRARLFRSYEDCSRVPAINPRKRKMIYTWRAPWKCAHCSKDQNEDAGLETKNNHAESRNTLLGVFSLLFWSSTIAFQRSLAEVIGALTANSYILLLGGSSSLIYTIASPERSRKILHLPTKYVVGCGSLFVIYMVSLYSAIGLASNRQSTLGVGLVNYLWPGLTLAFAVPILKRQARASLPIGIVMGFGGVFLAAGHGEEFWSNIVGSFSSDLIPYLLASIAALSWALYSNLARLWGSTSDGTGVPLFLVLSGSVLLVLSLIFPERTRWTSSAIVELVYMAIFPTMLAYTFWDSAMRRGRMLLLVSLSYFTPLLSMAFGATYLGVKTGWNLWLGCAFVVLGAVICKLSVRE